MVPDGSIKLRIGSILATSIGPLLLMLDLFAVVMGKGNIVFGFGPFGSTFPSPVGIIGLVIWLLGASFLISRRINRSRKRSAKARPVFLKGRTGIRCYNCKRWIDASGVGYQEMITCECGTNYNMFQEGPWDNGIKEKGSGSSSASRKLKENGRSRKRSAPLPRRK
ncbi:MAG: hypothetical protein U9R75_05010 [Candidatus Thermoplasmatota archaeon]|nr:hypothetical protein [Candidatus Thermoplasmatota archaeon]